MRTRGSICPKRSSTPCTPKSGEQRRPDRADGGRAEHGDDRLGHVRQVGGDAIAGPDAGGAQRRGKRGGLGAKLAPRHRPPALRLAMKMIAGVDRSLGAVEPASQDVLREVQRASGKNRAPGMRSMSTAIRLAVRPRTPPKSHIASQNASGSGMLQSYNSG